MESDDIRTSNMPVCGDYEGYTLIRFSLLTVASSVAFLGTCGNLLLIYIFSKQSCQKGPPSLYPTGEIVHCLQTNYVNKPH
ncbi:hypothetical protein AB6A40_009295 [Gnathostoma spinigerum]|uniref:Uncharacterized protein n=1 Tax=Gnathostoma spinigerum TaxID=75299 RepID=A0ABD6EYQ1_9BILA